MDASDALTLSLLAGVVVALAINLVREHRLWLAKEDTWTSA